MDGTSSECVRDGTALELELDATGAGVGVGDRSCAAARECPSKSAVWGKDLGRSDERSPEPDVSTSPSVVPTGVTSEKLVEGVRAVVRGGGVGLRVAEKREELEVSDMAGEERPGMGMAPVICRGGEKGLSMSAAAAAAAGARP